MSLAPDKPELPRPISPELLMGAASPLWGYFSSIAVGGVALWWMTRFAPQNLEALFAGSAQPAGLPALEVLEAETVAAEPLKVVGGEAAPISPLLETAPIVEDAEISPAQQALIEASGPVAPAEAPPTANARETADAPPADA